MNTAAKILLDGAHENGLKLIGDAMIGHKFIPVGEVSNAVDELLINCFDDVSSLHEWCVENSDGPYDAKLWKEAE